MKEMTKGRPKQMSNVRKQQSKRSEGEPEGMNGGIERERERERERGRGQRDTYR